jgi:hypothetical protein
MNAILLAVIVTLVTFLDYLWDHLPKPIRSRKTPKVVLEDKGVTS